MYNSKNYTIGTDGWSIHPFSNCFWKSSLVNLNGKTYHWEHNVTHSGWVEQVPTIHTPNLNLVSEFQELPLNDFDYAKDILLIPQLIWNWRDVYLDRLFKNHHFYHNRFRNVYPSDVYIRPREPFPHTDRLVSTKRLGKRKIVRYCIMPLEQLQSIIASTPQVIIPGNVYLERIVFSAAFICNLFQRPIYTINAHILSYIFHNAPHHTKICL